MDDQGSYWPRVGQFCIITCYRIKLIFRLGWHGNINLGIDGSKYGFSGIKDRVTRINISSVVLYLERGDLQGVPVVDQRDPIRRFLAVVGFNCCADSLILALYVQPQLAATSMGVMKVFIGPPLVISAYDPGCGRASFVVVRFRCLVVRTRGL